MNWDIRGLEVFVGLVRVGRWFGWRSGTGRREEGYILENLSSWKELDFG